MEDIVAAAEEAKAVAEENTEADPFKDGTYWTLPDGRMVTSWDAFINYIKS